MILRRTLLAADLYLYTSSVLVVMLCAILGGNNFSTCPGVSIGARIVRPSDAIIIASAGVFLGTLLEAHKLSRVIDGHILPSLSASGLLVILVGSLVVMTIVTVFRLPLALSQVTVGAGWGLALATGVRIRSEYSTGVVGLNPSTALSAQFGGAVSVHLFTQLGLPVSISQGVIGGMEGAASVKRISITNRRLLQQIVAEWTIGPMAGAVISFLLMKAI